jgi:cobalamin biosynthesis Co2+ chelatase CbiK
MKIVKNDPELKDHLYNDDYDLALKAIQNGERLDNEDELVLLIGGAETAVKWYHQMVDRVVKIHEYRKRRT